MNNLTLEQRSEFLKALWIVASYCQDDDDDLIRQLFVQNIHLMNEIKRLYLEDLGLEEVDLEDL
jgi:hypothetical protein